jgi:DNA invertase Pin-like site-specific DNA recombinase
MAASIGHNLEVVTRDLPIENVREFLVISYGHNGGDRMAIYGYARVSTDGQTLEGQIDQLAKAGAIKVFSEKESGAKSDRAQLAKAIAALDTGDVLIVTKLDRLARATRDLLNVLKTIEDKGALFKSLHETWADNTTPIGKMITTILGSVAEFERTRILERTSEGRTRAMSKGIKFGPKFKLQPAQLEEAKRQRVQGKSLVEIGQLFGVNYRTIGRALSR